MTERQ
jgi:hypothetical protein